MATEGKKKIYINICKFIMEELEYWMDNQIFIKESMKELGELYYTHILNKFIESDVSLLNAVIKNINPNLEYTTQEDYYIALCEILRFKKLPAEVWKDVERAYDEIFIRNYDAIMRKYKAEISEIDEALIKLKTGSDIIKKAKPTNSFIRDISTDEHNLYELSSKCNSLRTRKEMLGFVINYVTLKLSDFCDTKDSESIERAKKQETLRLCKENNYNAAVALSLYRDYVDIAEDDLDRPYALFFKVKIYIIIEKAREKYYESYHMKSTEERISECKTYLQQIPEINDLNSYKNSNPDGYNKALGKLILDYSLLEEMVSRLESSVCLRERKDVLLKAVELYKNGEYAIFNNVVPIQIEGMFADYLKDTTTFLRFSKMDIYLNAVLKDKIRYLQEVKSDIYPEAVEYFMYYFNNMIRNKIAHGGYKGNPDNQIEDEVFAKELILDLGMLVYMLSRKSETEKMYRFISGYKKYYESVVRSPKEHKCFGALFNDMIGNKIISDYDTFEKYRPIQVAYWLVNPYYEKIYGQVDNKNDLLDLRNEFLSKEFWEYVLENLNNVIDKKHDYLKINMEFLSVVKGLFGCEINSDVRSVLGRVHAALLEIKKMQQEER